MSFIDKINHYYAKINASFNLAKAQIEKHEANEDEIRNLAYLKWEAAGSPEGCGDEFWLAAKTELENNA